MFTCCISTLKSIFKSTFRVILFWITFVIQCEGGLEKQMILVDTARGLHLATTHRSHQYKCFCLQFSGFGTRTRPLRSFSLICIKVLMGSVAFCKCKENWKCSTWITEQYLIGWRNSEVWNQSSSSSSAKNVSVFQIQVRVCWEKIIFLHLDASYLSVIIFIQVHLDRIK